MAESQTTRSEQETRKKLLMTKRQYGQTRPLPTSFWRPTQKRPGIAGQRYSGRLGQVKLVKRLTMIGLRVFIKISFPSKKAEPFGKTVRGIDPVWKSLQSNRCFAPAPFYPAS